MRTPFDDLLDEMTETRDDDPAKLGAADLKQIANRLARVERIMQRMLLAIVEERAEEPKDDRIVEIVHKPRTR